MKEVGHIFISKIKIQNIKGKATWENTFDGLCSNKVNLFVAPNGFGKSTLTAAFTAASHGRMRLDNDDYYNQDACNIPKLEITYRDDNGTINRVESDNQHGDVSRTFYIHVINSPVYAKATGRNMGGYATQSAKLFIRDIEVCEKVEHIVIPYRFSDMRNEFGRHTPNISGFLTSESGLRFILEHRNALHKCATQIRIQSILVDTNSENAGEKRANFCGHAAAEEILCALSDEFGLSEIDQVRYLIQLVKCEKSGDIEKAQSALKWIVYQRTKRLLDERLTKFNTTGLPLRSAVRNNKLVVSFGRAGRMSNGERDVLYFVANLIAFSISVKNKPCILIVDEVFDYLDGTNLLAVQYYLSQFLNRIKSDGNIVFPILMTHLDPAVFSSYHFKGMAVHYLTNMSDINLNDKFVKLLQLRSTLKQSGNPLGGELEKYLLHFYPVNWTIPPDILSQLPNGFWTDSQSFVRSLYSEISNKYLGNQDYNVLAVILGLRIKIEEKTVALIPEDIRCEYYNKHGSKEKLAFADLHSNQIPEIFYLLQPLYNEALHLRNGQNTNRENKNRIESAYLKLSSNIIKEMVGTVFQ